MTSSRGVLQGFALTLMLAGSSAGFAAGPVELISRADPGRLSDTAAGAQAQVIYPSPPSLSADGRWVAFLSSANNLVAGQTGPAEKTGSDVFLHDRVSGATVLVSHSTASPTATSALGAESAVLSADGRWAAFVSESADLAPLLPSAPLRRLFLYDRVTGTNTLIGPSAFLDANGGEGVGSVEISADGRYVAFTSDAPDLVPGQQDANGSSDVFLYDRGTGSVALVSHATPASKAGNGPSTDPSLSADGRWIAFASGATDLDGAASGVFLYDSLSGSLRRIGPGTAPVISAGGGAVAFFSNAINVSPGQVDANGADDLFLFDRVAGTITLVSHTAGSATTTADAGAVSGAGARPALSPDGRWIAYLSNATDLVTGQAAAPGPGPAVFLYDRAANQSIVASRIGTAPTTPRGDPSLNPSLSADGRLVAFDSEIAGVSNVFLFDRATGAISLVSGFGSNGSSSPEGFSYGASVSADGSRIAYYSGRSDLQPGVSDLNGGEDVLLYDTAARTNAYATLHAPGAPSLTSDAGAQVRGISGDGRWVLFESTAANLVAGQSDGYGQSDIFLYDRTARSAVLVSRAAASPIAAGDDASDQSGLSADGRYVAFASLASNLVAGVNDPPASSDIFLFDRVTAGTVLVSRSAADPNAPGDGDSLDPAISADGRWVAFDSEASDLVQGITDANRTSDVFLWDRTTGARTLVSRSAANSRKAANGFSNHPLLSSDGRYVLYESSAADLVPGQVDDPDAGTTDLFLFDRVASTTALVTHARGAAATAAGTFDDPLPALSADGRYVAFASRRADLTATPGGELNVYLYDREGGALTLAGASPSNSALQPALSADGRWLAFLSTGVVVPGVPNPTGTDQLYLYDRTTRAVTLVSRSAGSAVQGSNGSAAEPALSADGRYLTFTTGATNLAAGPGVQLFDRVAGTLATAAPGDSPRISADGKVIAFESDAPGLVAGDSNGRTDVFAYPTGAGGSGGPVTLPPCNLFNGALRSNVRKVLTVAGACGVPAGAKQVVVKLTVSQGTGKGNVQIYPGNVTNPASGILRFTRGASRSGSFTVPLGNGVIALLPFVAGNGTVRVGVEVDGYVP
ncbi:MAG: TolB family protein [Thermoanaerobaculia bacterium]